MKVKKCLLSVLAICCMAVLLVIPAFASEVTETGGECGETLSWTLDGNTLVVRGTGDMYDYVLQEDEEGNVVYVSTAPWSHLINSIYAVEVEEGVTSVGEGAFAGCKSLEAVTLSDGVETIGVNAFAECVALRRLELPLSLVSIGEEAFRGCSFWPLEIYYHGSYEQWELFQEKFGNIGNKIYTIQSGICGKNANWTLDLEGTLTITGTGAIGEEGLYFRGDNLAKKVIVKEGITSIGDSTFALDSIQEVELPATLTEIGESAFWGSGISHIELPNGISSIGYGAFEGCASLKEIQLPDSLAVIPEYCFEGCSNLERVEIPSNVTAIERGAFMRCVKLKTVTLPDDLEVLGREIFMYSGLESIVLPEGITTISDYMFCECESLTEIVLPHGITDIGSGAFSQCSSLRNINLPMTLGTIGSYAFEDTALTSISIPDFVYKISNGAFKDSKNLKNVTFASNPGAPLQLGENVFKGCTGLAVFVVPNTVDVISAGTFSGCTGLTDVVLPKGVSCVGREAFFNCTGLKRLSCDASLIDVEENAFAGCTALTDVYYDGDEMMWRWLNMGTGNACLTDATVHYLWIPPSSSENPNPIPPDEELPPENVCFRLNYDDVSWHHSMLNFGMDSSGAKDYSENSVGIFYPTDRAYYEKLNKGLSRGKQKSLLNVMNNGENGEWIGSCQGLSTMMAQARSGWLSVSRIGSPENNGGKQADYCHKLTIPRLNLKLRDVINYYHLLQYADKIPRHDVYSQHTNKKVRTENYGKTDTGVYKSWATKDWQTWDNFWTLMVVKVRAASSRKTPLIFRFTFEGDDGENHGHAILATGVSLDNPDYIVFEMYDCNNLDTMQYLYVSPKKYGVFYWGTSVDDPTPKKEQKPNVTEKNWLSLEFYCESAMNEIGYEYEDTIVYGDASANQKRTMASQNAGNVVLEIDAYTPLRIENSKGEYLKFDGVEYTGTMKVLDMQSIGDESPEFHLTVEADNMFRVTEFEDNCCVGIQTDGEYYTARTVGADEMCFTMRDGIRFAGDNYTFEAGLSASSEIKILSSEGTCSGDSSITQNADGIILDTTGQYTNVTVEVSTPDGVTDQQVNGNFQNAEVDNNGKVVSIDGNSPEIPEKVLYDIVVENGEGSGKYAYNAPVIVRAAENSGQTFTGWQVNGKTVSMSAEYKFFASCDMTLTAVYEKNPALEADSLMTNVITTKRSDGRYDVKFVAQLILPNGYELEDAGLVWSNRGREYADEEILNLAKEGSAGVKVTRIKAISNTWQFSVTIKGVPNGIEVPGRIFAKMVDNKGEEKTVHSTIGIGGVK